MCPAGVYELRGSLRPARSTLPLGQASWGSDRGTGHAARVPVCPAGVQEADAMRGIGGQCAAGDRTTRFASTAEASALGTEE
eukprot:589611-Heterocapsa_arctica.AAC.1